MYTIEYKGKAIPRKFYPEELQNAVTPKAHRIEKVLKRDKKNRRALVRWLGYDKEDDSWVSFDDILEKKNGGVH